MVRADAKMMIDHYHSTLIMIIIKRWWCYPKSCEVYLLPNSPTNLTSISLSSVPTRNFSNFFAPYNCFLSYCIVPHSICLSLYAFICYCFYYRPPFIIYIYFSLFSLNHFIFLINYMYKTYFITFLSFLIIFVVPKKIYGWFC